MNTVVFDPEFQWVVPISFALSNNHVVSFALPSKTTDGSWNESSVLIQPPSIASFVSIDEEAELCFLRILAIGSATLSLSTVETNSFASGTVILTLNITPFQTILQSSSSMPMVNFGLKAQLPLPLITTNLDPESNSRQPILFSSSNPSVATIVEQRYVVIQGLGATDILVSLSPPADITYYSHASLSMPLQVTQSSDMQSVTDAMDDIASKIRILESRVPNVRQVIQQLFDV